MGITAHRASNHEEVYTHSLPPLNQRCERSVSNLGAVSTFKFRNMQQFDKLKLYTMVKIGPPKYSRLSAFPLCQPTQSCPILGVMFQPVPECFECIRVMCKFRLFFPGEVSRLEASKAGHCYPRRLSNKSRAFGNLWQDGRKNLNTR